MSDPITRLNAAPKLGEKQWAEVVGGMHAGVAMIGSPDGVIIYANPSFESMFGYEPGELLGQHVSKLNGGTEEEAAATNLDITASIEKEGGWRGEVLNARKDGSEFWSLGSVTTFHHSHHGMVGMGVHEDITERKRAEEALRQSEQNLTSMIEGAQDGIVVVVEGRVVSANAAALEMSGYTREGILGKSPIEFVHQDDQARAAERIAGILDGTLDGKATGIWEYRTVRSDGEFYPVEISSTLITFEGKEALLSTIRDITERKRVEEALKNSLHEKEVLLKEVHHRVKNNLQLVASLVSIQSRRVTEDSARAALYQTAQRVKSMSLVHEQLLQKGNVASIDFEKYLEELVSSLVSQSRDVSGPIEAVVQCDVDTVGIDLANTCGLIVNELVSNAISHAFPGGDPGRIRIEFRSGADAETYRLVVADDGIGIPIGVDPLAADTLGLRLVRLLAGQIQGTLAVDIVGGTVWDITIPMDK
jgi:PAS domain S-box-containing protein